MGIDYNLFVLFTFLPYINFGVHNYLTNKGELVYYYLIIAIIAIISGRAVNAFKNKLLYILLVPLLIDLFYSIIINDPIQILKILSIMIITIFLFSLKISRNIMKILTYNLIVLLVLHILCTMYTFFFPIPFWYQIINFGELRGNVFKYLFLTMQYGKYIRGLNTEPGTNINIILLLSNLVGLSYAAYSNKLNNLKIPVILALLNMAFFVLIRALRMFFIIPINMYYAIKCLKETRLTIKNVMLLSLAFIPAIYTIFFTVFQIMNSESFYRITNFIKNPIFTIKTDPSIQLHIAKLLGKLSPSGFSVFFIYGHFCIFIYFVILISLILNKRHFLRNNMIVNLTTVNIISISLFSSLIASYHSPYNITALVLTFKILQYISKNDISCKDEYKIAYNYYRETIHKK